MSIQKNYDKYLSILNKNNKKHISIYKYIKSKYVKKSGKRSSLKRDVSITSCVVENYP